MNCPSCEKEIMPDSYFCSWCNIFIPLPSKGKKANLFTRVLALAMDFFIAMAFLVLAVVVAGAIQFAISGQAGPSENPNSGGLGFALMVLFAILYFIWFLTLLRKGTTPGKKAFGIQVINQLSGDIPGFQKMFLREIIGRLLSGMFFGFGYIWALLDKNAQAFHDKLAGTVVVKLEK